ncbi:MAG: polysaccharide deacetylase family protein [Gemmatimonadetes bacterium]|nr:polysaccharide deacetylase family protein [Gemmatimonadota bacterium]
MIRAAILTYHAIGNPPPGDWPTPVRTLFVEPALFRAQMEALRDFGYRGISLRELLAGPSPARPRPLVLTFDDGYRSFLTDAFPILADLGFHATVFVVAGHVGGYSAWPFRVPILDAHELRELAHSGIEIGSHGMTHRSLRDLTESERVFELAESKRLLEEIVGNPVESFAFPYGHEFAGAETLLRSMGYGVACSTRRDNRNTARDRYALHRIMASSRTTRLRLRYYLSRLYHVEASWKRATRALRGLQP